jgi:hypothetical protein
VRRRIVCTVLSAAALWVMPTIAYGQILVADNRAVREYYNNGATLNPSLITGVDVAYDLAVSGMDLYLTNFGSGLASDGSIANTQLQARP